MGTLGLQVQQETRALREQPDLLDVKAQQELLGRRVQLELWEIQVRQESVGARGLREKLDLRDRPGPRVQWDQREEPELQGKLGRQDPRVIWVLQDRQVLKVKKEIRVQLGTRVRLERLEQRVQKVEKE